MSLHQKTIWGGNLIKLLEFLQKFYWQKLLFPANPSAKTNHQLEELQQILETTDL